MRDPARQEHGRRRGRRLGPVPGEAVAVDVILDVVRRHDRHDDAAQHVHGQQPVAQRGTGRFLGPGADDLFGRDRHGQRALEARSTGAGAGCPAPTRRGGRSPRESSAPLPLAGDSPPGYLVSYSGTARGTTADDRRTTPHRPTLSRRSRETRESAVLAQAERLVLAPGRRGGARLRRRLAPRAGRPRPREPRGRPHRQHADGADYWPEVLSTAFGRVLLSLQNQAGTTVEFVHGRPGLAVVEFAEETVAGGRRNHRAIDERRPQRPDRAHAGRTAGACATSNTPATAGQHRGHLPRRPRRGIPAVRLSPEYGRFIRLGQGSKQHRCLASEPDSIGGRRPDGLHRQVPGQAADAVGGGPGAGRQAGGHGRGGLGRREANSACPSP